MLRNIVMELNNFLVNHVNIWTLFMLYYGRKNEFLFFYTKKQASSFGYDTEFLLATKQWFQLIIINKLFTI